MYENDCEMTILASPFSSQGYHSPKNSSQNHPDFWQSRNDPTTPEETRLLSEEQLIEQSQFHHSPSRMENVASISRLTPGIYHRKPQPILSSEPSSPKENTLEREEGRGEAVLESRMRQPPPTWLPPQPPIQDIFMQPEEETYENPENLHQIKTHSSRDRLMLLVNGNSYEVSASQLRRSQDAPPLDDWSPAECILHKNSDGAYYIPTSSACAPSPSGTTNTTSTIPHQPHLRYDKRCSSSRNTCTEPQVNTALLKRQSTLNQKKMGFKEESMNRRSTSLIFCLLLALLVALLVIIILLLRSPRYVYSSTYMGQSSMTSDRLSELRPLPETIQLDQLFYADLIPQSIAYTEIYIPRPMRVMLNVTIGTGAQLVLFGRHSVAPSLSLHDLFHPIRAELIEFHRGDHSIEENSRRRREAIEILAPRTSSVEHFILEGRWHLAILNERNRIEPIELLVQAFPNKKELLNTNGETKNNIFRCASDCSSRGECINGVCKCAIGYRGVACEEVVCPMVCSGNGVFSLGRCVCFDGYKGRECDVRDHWCEVADCNGRGRCTPRGVCDCISGWTGDSCEIRSCPHESCSHRGKCLDGVCYCEDGWSGKDCSRDLRIPIIQSIQPLTPEEKGLEVEIEASPLSPTTLSSHSLHPHRIKAHDRINNPDQIINSNSIKAPTESSWSEPADGQRAIDPCNDRGKLGSKGLCVCNRGFMGAFCEKTSCSPRCIEGRCQDGNCRCKNGWMGIDCSQKECALGCEQHGRCEKNGTCLCDRGWNGDNCYQEGCPKDCSGHGQCRLGTQGWRCECDTSRRGSDCFLSIEDTCDDGIDNDHNGLTDCEDPSCCSSNACRSEPSCIMAPSPTDVLLKLPTPQNAPFYQRVMFLIKNDSVQSYADSSQYNQSVVSVVCGRVVWNGGVAGTKADLALPGVRVSDANHPLYGFTLSRLDDGGAFDLLVNGGRTIQIQFLRSPFQRKTISIYVPPNQIVYVGDVILYKDKNSEEDLQSRVRNECVTLRKIIEPIEIRNDWKIWGSTKMQEGGRVLADTGAVIDSIKIPGTQIYLVYDSRRSDGSPSRLEMRLTGANPHSRLRLIHLQIHLAGRRFTRKLAARANLYYTFTWDKYNAYKQMESGLVPTIVRIGYEYENCDRESEIIWMTKRTFMSGKSRKIWFGGWSPHIHHHYDVINNVLEKGDGSRLFLSSVNPVVHLLIGNESKRDLECQNCGVGKADSALFRPVSVASGLDGSIFIGDHNLIRRLTPQGDLITLLTLSVADTTYQYSLAVSPLDGSVFISIPLQKQIWKIKDSNPKDRFEKNYEVVAGDGTACTSATSSCGDGGLASEAQLLFPKGLSIDNHNQLYVADGRRIRVIDLKTNMIRSLTNSHFREKSPVEACSQDLRQFVPISDLQIEWPTSLATDPLSSTLYVLDTNVIYELKIDSDLGRIVLGFPSACMANSSSLALLSVRDIAMNSNGYLYILESDGKKLNQVRRYSSSEEGLEKIAGRISPCSCQGPFQHSQCHCDNHESRVHSQDALFNSPLSISIDLHGNVLIADTGNAKIKSIHHPTATFDPITSQYTVAWPSSAEVYSFNRNGLHMSTRNLITDQLIYTFNYNVDTHLGRLSQIVSPGGLLCRALWSQNDENSVSIESPSGLRSQLSLSPFDGHLESIIFPNKETIKLHYALGGLLISRSGGSEGITRYDYDLFGRANSIYTKNHIYTIDEPSFEEDFLVVRVKRDNEELMEIKDRPGESYLKGQINQKLLALDEDSFEWTEEAGSKILYESEMNQLWGVRSVLRARKTWPSVSNPPRSSLVWRFDWRPSFSQKQNLRMAEVNGLNMFSFAYDRTGNFDIFRGKGEEMILKIEYTDSGEWKKVTTGNEISLAPLNIKYDALGRRNQISWGSIERKFLYDRQNRLIESNWGSGDHVYKYNYFKDFLIPVQIDLPNGNRYSIKLDQLGRIQQVISPSGEIHQFSTIILPQGTLIKRRMPQWKGQFLSLMNGDQRLLEWVSADGIRHVRIKRDSRDRPIQIFLDQHLNTKIEYTNNQISFVSGRNYEEKTIRQAELPIEIHLRRSYGSGWKDSNFSMTYDHFGRIESLQGVIEDQSIIPIQWKYHKQSGRIETIAGFTFVDQANSHSISNNKMKVESEFDNHCQLLKRKVIFGDKECSLQINRDKYGREISSELRRSSAIFTQEIGFESGGRVAEFMDRNGEKSNFKYDKNGRINSINGHPIEWANGGIVRKFRDSIYISDANGWILKKGNLTYKMDSMGRLLEIVEKKILIEYDYLDRVILIKRGSKQYSFFYAFHQKPTLISHYIDSETSLLTSLLYTDDGELFSLLIGADKYLVLSDTNRSPLCILSENRIVKEIDRSLFGAIIKETNNSFWIPVSHLGGIDLWGTGVLILNGRPMDMEIGRWMSFGPSQMEIPKDLSLPQMTLDPMALGEKEGIASYPQIPSGIESWLQLSGISSLSLSPTASLLPIDSSNSIPVLSAVHTAFQQRLSRNFGRLGSVSRSMITETLPTMARPILSGEDPGFVDLLFIASTKDKLIIKFSPKLTAEEQKLLSDLLDSAIEVEWPLTEGSSSRHFSRISPIDGRFSSISHPHFTMVVGADLVELRSANTRITVHFETNQDAVRSKLSDELRRKEAHSVWKVERKLIEGVGIGRRNWTMDERIQLQTKGFVSGYSVEPQPSSTLLSAHHWTFIKLNSKL